MARFFTSDLHIGHANVIRYCDRPFHEVGEMNAALSTLWSGTVTPDDEVWILGDLAMGSREESLAVVSGLPGHKHLVVGNHDKPFKGQKIELYEDSGLELHHGVVELTLAGSIPVLACHFPYEGDSLGHDRHVDRRPHDDGRWLLHGHVHSQWRQRGRMINVGVDAWGGVPVDEETVVRLINAGENHLAPVGWTRVG